MNNHDSSMQIYFDWLLLGVLGHCLCRDSVKWCWTTALWVWCPGFHRLGPLAVSPLKKMQERGKVQIDFKCESRLIARPQLNPHAPSSHHQCHHAMILSNCHGKDCWNYLCNVVGLQLMDIFGCSNNTITVTTNIILTHQIWSWTLFFFKNFLVRYFR